MSSPTHEADAHAGTSQRLSGKLGPISIVFMVVAAAAPLTIFVSTPVNMLNGNGPGIAFSYIVGPLIMLLFGAGFAAMSIHVEKAGAFYSYITAAMGRPVGVGAGFLAMLGYFLFQAFVYMLLGFSVEGLFVSLIGTGILPWWGWTLVAVAIVALLGYLSIDLSAKVLAVALILEVIVILVIDFAILFQGGGPEGIQVAPFFSVDAITWGSLPLGILFGISVGLGFEATAIFRDEAREPRKTIPRAIFISIIAAAVFYGFAIWGWMQAFGVNGVMDAVAEDPVNIMYTTAAEWVGPVFMQVMSVLAITSMFACVLSYHNIVTRYLHSLGHSVLPQRLTWVHRKHRSPYVASLVTTAIGAVVLLAVVVSGLDPFMVFGWFIAVGTLAPLVLFTLTSVAIVVFFRRNRGLPVSIWSSTISPILSFLLLGAIAVTALLNFSVLSAADPAVNVVLQLLPVAVFLIGVVVALVAKRVDPQRYEGLREHGTASVRVVDTGDGSDAPPASDSTTAVGSSER
ncbi:APC family permease [Agromyces bracchium]|uniref:Amino acid permease n=1 Tax=Agromyces bracchium TaxID=88376 RepID=A0A6I3M881_9MICO|nr:APC family permease [Agromyces bracchium]MTH69435.1 amino acid permease [Agromyces bracchium]